MMTTIKKRNMKEYWIQTKKSVINRDIDLEKINAGIYLFILPFHMISQFGLLIEIFGVCANYTAFIFHILGLFFWLLSTKGKINLGGVKNETLFKYATLLLGYLILSSVVMACVIQLKFGNHGRESAFRGVFAQCVYFIQYWLIFLYSIRIFQLFEIDEILSILLKVCNVILILGYFQVLVINGVGKILYEKLDIFDIFVDPTVRKLALTETEGASCGIVLGIFVFPVLMAQVLNGKIKYLFNLLLWVIPLYYSNSSTAYIVCFIDLIVFFLMVKRNKRIPKTLKICLASGLAVAVFLIVAILMGFIKGEVIDSIRYLIINKITDNKNASSVARRIPYYINWGAFKEYPIFGVGNGLQGYFYKKYFPDWAYGAANYEALIKLKQSENEIFNGALFIPSLLSGYGVVGCFFVFLFIKKVFSMIKKHKHEISAVYNLFLISFIAFLVNGMQGEVSGIYLVWFMMSLPLAGGIQNAS